MVATRLSWRNPSSWQSGAWLRRGIPPFIWNDHVMAEAEGHAGNQLSRFPDEASNCPSSVPVHVGL
jgi:hypothetical protein